jgi:predicted RND superfamily exporter protein
VVVGFEQRLGGGESRREAAWGAAADKARGVALALGTTAIGFSSLALAEVIPIRTFGLLAAAGLAAGGPLVLYALPLLLAALGPTRVRSAVARREQRVEDALERVARWAEARPVRLGGAAVGLVLASALAVPHLRPSTHTVAYFPEGHPVREAHEALERAGAGLMTLEAVVKADDPILGRLDAFAATATAAPEIRARLDLALLLREARFRATGSDAVPNGQEAAMYLARRPELEAALRDEDHHRAAFFLETSNGQDLDRLSARLRAAHDAHLPGTELVLTGTYDLIIRSQQSLLDTLVASLALTVLLMELVVLLATRSLRLTLVALLPNLVPVAVNVLLLFALRLPLDVGTAMTGAVALGIAVDDTLHFLVAWREEGTRRAIRKTGRALLLSTVVIAAGFFALVPSSFLPTRNFALLTGSAIVAALVADLLLLPPLLRACRRPSGAGDGPEPA